MQLFVADNWEKYKSMFETDVTSDFDAFCSIANDFRVHLHSLEECKDTDQDEFMKICSLFLHISDDFLLFVKSYRSNDALAVVKGYAWEALGQNKYVACYHNQLNEMLVRHLYRRYVEALMNRMVCTQPGGSGKGVASQDEYIELMNRLFAIFPEVRTLKGMGRLGDILGMTQKAKRFAQMFYIKGEIDTERKVTHSGGKAKQTPEKMAIYELFKFLFANRPSSRQMSYGLVRKFVDGKKVKVDLENHRLEDRMKAISECLASRLINCVNHIWSEEINGARNISKGTELDAVAAQEDAISRIEVGNASINEGWSDGSETSTLGAEMKLPNYCIKSPWDAGIEMMAKVNYVEVWRATKERSQQKYKVVKFIVEKVKAMENNSMMDAVADRETVEPAPWTMFLHALDQQYCN